MIRIDRLSFEFEMNNEEFAHGLYADPERFCRVCFEQVAEECLSRYGKDRLLHEIDRLDLDLGTVAEEDFYREFPRRLRAELLKVLPSLHVPVRGEWEKTEASRTENLLFYLEHGYPRTEWADETFSPAEELNLSAEQSAAFTRRLLKLCLSKEYVLRRLLCQADAGGAGPSALLRLYAALLSEPAFSLREKRHFLTVMLEIRPDLPVRFVHAAQGDACLKDMAELLDTVSVRRMMETEAEEHAEVDLPPYWHYLYEWLVRYYPFNGLAVFGGKSDFVRHLHFRLLTFIRKRNYSFHLSKTELTVGFLLEVFGSAYYMEVLNAIYHMQPRNADGSPLYDSYFNRELYRIFLQLSLLRLPAAGEKEKEEYASGKEKPSRAVFAEALNGFLKDARRSEADKRMLLGLLMRENPEVLGDRLQKAVRDKAAGADGAMSEWTDWMFERSGWVSEWTDWMFERSGWVSEWVSDWDSAMVSAVAERADDEGMDRLLASVSFEAFEAVGQVKDYLRSHASEIGWLSGVTEAGLKLALRKAVLYWIGEKAFAREESEGIRQLLRLVLREITGSDNPDAMETLLMKLHLEKKDWEAADNRNRRENRRDRVNRKAAESSAENKPASFSVLLLRKLRRALSGNHIPESVKRRLLAHFLEQHRENYTDAVLLLHKENLLTYAAPLISLPVLEEIISRLVGSRPHSRSVSRSEETYGADKLLPLLYWLIAHKTILSVYLKDKAPGLRVQLLLWLARTVQSPIGSGMAFPQPGVDSASLQPHVNTAFLQSDANNLPFRAGTAGIAGIAGKKRTLSAKLCSLLTALFGKENLQPVIAVMFRELALETGDNDVQDNPMRKENNHRTDSRTDDNPMGSNHLENNQIESNRIENTPENNHMEDHHPENGNSQNNHPENNPSADYFSETALNLLLQLTGSGQSPVFQKDSYKKLFKEWQHQSEDISTRIQTLWESRWNTDEGFAAWLEDTGTSAESKRELLQKTAVEQPQEWIRLLRMQHDDSNQYGESKTLALAAALMPASLLLQGMALVNFRQAAVLSRTVERLQRSADRFSFLSGNNTPLSAVLSKALLLYIRREDLSGGILPTESETVCKFLSCLHLVCTGKPDCRDDARRTDLFAKADVETEAADRQEIREKEISDILSIPNILSIPDVLPVSEALSTSDKDPDALSFRRRIAFLAERHPEQLLAHLEEEADRSLIERIADVSDVTIRTRWTFFLSTVPGFEYPDAFRRLTEWLYGRSTDRAWTSDTMSVLLSWLKETDWRKQTPAQMEDYFISRLLVEDTVRLPIEKIADDVLPESIRKRLLHHYVRLRPKELSDYIRRSVKDNTVPLSKWLEWTDAGDWLRLAAGLSLSRAELLKQIADCLSANGRIKKADLPIALAACLVGNRAEEWMYIGREEIVRLFVGSLPALREKPEAEKETLIRNIKKELNITDGEDRPSSTKDHPFSDPSPKDHPSSDSSAKDHSSPEIPAKDRWSSEALTSPSPKDLWFLVPPTDSPEVLFIANAGLCLLSPWFPRLLGILGYLNEDKRDFKDTASRVRAVFLLQYLACPEEKAYRETELAFNRLLVSLPMYIPLPERLPLTDGEKQTAESLLASVKTNWPVMKGTSVTGFRRSFVTRTGRLEQQEGRWLLTVDSLTIDILLDSVPWGFRQIRFPWLKKYIQVLWHEKQEF